MPGPSVRTARRLDCDRTACTQSGVNELGINKPKHKLSITSCSESMGRTRGASSPRDQTEQKSVLLFKFCVNHIVVTLGSTGRCFWWRTGVSTGSTAMGNTFNFCPNAIVLSSATGLTIGGLAAGQPNRINSSARSGVFATGFCTGSSVIKTTFSATPVPYNIGGSRNLRVVQ